MNRFDVGVSPKRINGTKAGMLPDPVVGAFLTGGKIEEITGQITLIVSARETLGKAGCQT